MDVELAPVIVDGESLTIEKVVAVARYDAPVRLSESCYAAIDRARAMVEKILAEDRRVYGISTGFGEFSKINVGHEQSGQLQENLILSHCVAVGTPFGREIVRAMMLLRANALVRGNSGIRRELIECLIDMLNKGVTPEVPRQGSLGASGDLAPLAHMALVLIGRGEAWYQGEKLPGAEAMRRAGIPTYHLLAKEGLALINGTQCMTAIGTMVWYDLDRGARLADITASMTMEALTALTSAFDPRIHALRPQRGQSLVARNIRLLLENSPTAEASKDLRVQDAYAIRCIPQVHGAVRDSIAYVRSVLEIEMTLLHLRAPSRAHGEPHAFERSARLFDPPGRPQLRLHDLPVRGGLHRVREQGPRPSRQRGQHPLLRQSGGPCEHGHHRGEEMPDHRKEPVHGPCLRAHGGGPGHRPSGHR